MALTCPSETFDALSGIPGLQHRFLTRVPGLEFTTDKAAALEKLAPYHQAGQAALGMGDAPLITGEQVHSSDITTVTRENLPELSHQVTPAVDGFVTNLEGVMLGIYVADCCAVYLVDPVKRALGLVHSGKKGTELAITSLAIETMTRCYDTDPKNLIIQLSPCIRPPAYEVDFAADIRQQAQAAGVPQEQVFDPGTCTAQNQDRYYSYRMEKGETGRMLALFAWNA